MAIRIQVITSSNSVSRFEHSTGPLEFGRGVQRDARRCRIDDPTVSDDHLRIQQADDEHLQIENLSQQRPVRLPENTTLQPARSITLRLPIELSIGQTRVLIESTQAPAIAIAESQPTLETIAFVAVAPANEKGSSDQLAEWLKTLIELEHMPAGSTDFYNHVAHTLVNLIGMDLGLVLLKKNNQWIITGSATTEPEVQIQFSRTLVNYATDRRQTFFEDLNQLPATASLEHLQAGVAAPIFGLHDEVVGVLYGSRSEALNARGAVGPMEAQLVQLLSNATGANLARATALRTRVQFEQFFSPELVRELERDPTLLEGRTEEVTLLFSDLRGFTTLSQQLGAAKTCRLIRDMMEVLSEQISLHAGVIVDYVGDGILAMWNAPTHQADHAARACNAALAMLGELPGLNSRWLAEIGQPLELGIGINTGSAQVGNLGSPRKFKYGPNGHTVNLACRVQDATKSLGIPLLITASTREQLPASFTTRRLGQVQLIDVLHPMMLFELHQESATPQWLKLRDHYEKALSFFEINQFENTLETLKLADVSDKISTELNLRARYYLEANSTPDPVVFTLAGKSSSMPSGSLPRLSSSS